MDGGCSTRGEVPGTNLSLLLLHFCFYLKEAMGKDSGLSELGVGGWAGLLTEPARSSYGQASWGAWGKPQRQPHGRSEVVPAQHIPEELSLQEGAAASLSLEARPVWGLAALRLEEETAARWACILNTPHARCLAHCAPHCGETALVLSPGRNPSCRGQLVWGPPGTQ